jgi:hypothetical protein
VKDVATAGAAIVAAVVAVLGLRAWRRQLRGQTQYELARRLLRAVYRVRDEIQGVRNPVIMASEFETARHETQFPPKEKPLSLRQMMKPRCTRDGGSVSSPHCLIFRLK